MEWIYDIDVEAFVAGVDGPTYNYGVVGDNGEYAAYVCEAPNGGIGGYINDKLVISAGFGAVSALGFKPDTICKTIEEAKERCERYHKLNVLR